jgi:hypothetical protein
LAGGGTTTPEKAAGQDSPAPTFGTKMLWFALPACASVLLLAITNTMCLDVAVVPFLWVLPLSLYLLSFMLCFDSPRWYSRRLYTYALVPAVGLVGLALYAVHRVSVIHQVVVYSGALFVCCMLCHGELYRLKPPPAFLTSFYLLIATGGAAGGIFVAVIAPLIFRSYTELHWGLWLLSGLLIAVHARAGTSLAIGSRRVPGWACATLGSAMTGLLLVVVARQGYTDTIHTTRNFYGALRVRETFFPEGFVWTRRLYHGSTMHGIQMLPPQDPLVPIGYYRQGSGVELALSRFPRQVQRRIGVVGLGIGTLSIYGSKTDVVRFYEINPEIQRLAESMFTFLAGSQAQVKVVLGDARISLENELPQEFDVLVLDAFSSDAIPTHLLTREAFAVYARHLKPDGALLFNITNRHLDIAPVVETLASELQMQTLVMATMDSTSPGAFGDLVWMVASRNPELMNDPVLKQAAQERRGPARRVVWTDDHSSLLQVLVWRF